MHRKIVAGVSALLFVLMAVLASIVTDLHDRALPQQLGATTAVSLDYSKSGISDQEAFTQLADASDRLGLGLVKVAPDLKGDQSGQVIVALGQGKELPEQIGWFGGQPDAPVVDSAYLANSYASGQYLLTGDEAQIDAFRSLLAAQQVDAEWSFDTAGASLRVVLSQASFAASMLAAVVLMAVLILYWLSVKAKGRALRVLAGTPTWRIQYEDLTGFLVPILVAAAACDVVAAIYIGSAHGGVYVPYYIMVTLMLEAIVVLVTMLFALVASVVSWPSAVMLATRQPAVKSLRRTAAVLKAVTFVMVIAAAAPTAAALNESQQTAAQQAKWKSLADQVSVGFRLEGGSSGPEEGFQQLMAPVGELILDAQEQNIAAFSYAWEAEYLERSQIDAGTYQSLSLANPRWFDLMEVKLADEDTGDGAAPQLTRIPPQQVPEGIQQYLSASMELWVREDLSGAEALERVSFYEYSGSSTVPMARGGNGELLFLDNTLVALVEDLHLLNNDFLISVASSSNLSFTGLGPTQELIAQHGLQDAVSTQYIAEEGLLQAQFTAYFAWLQGIALVALSTALVVSAIIGAFITAVIKARRDFPLRLSGMPWRRVLAARVGAEWLIGGSLAATVIAVMSLQGSRYLALMGAVAVAGLVLSPLAHLLATRWSFNTVSLRKL